MFLHGWNGKSHAILQTLITAKGFQTYIVMKNENTYVLQTFSVCFMVPEIIKQYGENMSELLCYAYNALLVYMSNLGFLNFSVISSVRLLNSIYSNICQRLSQ
jgi:hypothetical protein